MMITLNPQEVDIPIENIIPHTEIPLLNKEKKMDHIEYTMKRFGQVTPILGNFEDGIFYVVDGIVRLEIAKKLGHKTLRCLPINISKEDVVKFRLTSNQRAKMSYSEMVKYAEHMLELVGKTQGKKKELLGFEDFDNEDHHGLVGKDRFELTCHLLDLPIKGSSLRKLMDIHWHEEKDDDSLGLIEGLDNNLFSLDAAHRLVKKDKKIQEKNLFKEWRKNEISNQAVWSKIFHQSSDDLLNLKKYRPNFAMFSPPYWMMKLYRNQGEMKYGQEPTVEDYINNCRKFIMSLIDIMDENGVIAIVIGESYQGGFKSVLARYELMLEERLDIIGKCPWIKENPTPSKVDGFFRPADETVFICKLKGGNHVFNPKMTPTKDGKKGIKNSHKSKNGGIRVFLQDEERVITNVIETPVCNPNEYKKYDPNFTHDAPCPMEVYQTIVESYTLPGMTAIDIHCGAGQGLEVFSQNGLNSLGVDIDIESVEFCRKRMSMVLGDDTSNDEIQLAA
ncbi:DNA methyltransferase [Aquirufa aurantiipilula]|uniref:DNA methyltransferase n=1 Tax=Aquirufa aurantiipilula TaxID=2696561 RepID=UPI001CAA5A76|nr:DNA methyltransferase [Aquirufa aurantiipilula]MBZ1325615.1 ParB N-terminal domain-containing protein [Aquirufa aurantiipilula]